MSFARAAPPAYCGGIGQSSSRLLLLLLLLLLSDVTRFSAPGDRSGGSAPSIFGRGLWERRAEQDPKIKCCTLK